MARPTSATHQVALSNGNHDVAVVMGDWAGHQMGFRITGPFTTATVTVSAKGRGMEIFELVPDGAIDMTAPSSLLFTFCATDYRFALSNVTGTDSSTQLIVVDVPMEG